MMGSLVTSDITESSRGLQFRSGHARGLTCSQIVNRNLYIQCFVILSVIFVYAFVEK